MNHNPPRYSTATRIGAPQLPGAEGRILRQQQLNSSSSSKNNERHVGGNKTNDSSTSTSIAKEGIVQKLQGVLFAVRRDRDREHRNRDIAIEKLRSAKDVYGIDHSNFEAEKEKLSKTQSEAERTQQEIYRLEKTIAELQKKYRFQHEDLIRKREKIQQQESSLEAAASKRNECMLEARRRLDRQESKSQELKQMEQKASEKLLATILSLASSEYSKNGTKFDNGIANEADDQKKNEKNETGSAEEPKQVDKTQAESGNDGDACNQKRSKGKIGGLDRFLDDLETKREAALMDQFKGNMDYYDILPQMITQKARDLQAESEKMRTEIDQLEILLYGTAKSKEEGKEQSSDVEMVGDSESLFLEDLVGGGIGDTKNVQAESTRLEHSMVHGIANSNDSKEQGQGSEIETVTGFGNPDMQEQGQIAKRPKITHLEALLHVAAQARDSQKPGGVNRD